MSALNRNSTILFVFALVLWISMVVHGMPTREAKSISVKRGLFSTQQMNKKKKHNDKLPIVYNGGSVMLGTVNVYNIFYGIWPSSSQQIVDDFISRISDSDYWNIEKAYHDGSNRNITGPVVKKDSIVNSFSKGSRLTENNMTQIIEDAFASGMAQDENGIYFILTSEDVTVSGFCNSYCGYHLNATIANKLIKYSFVGVPEKCMSNCSLLNQESSPNGNPPVDAMISVIAHELVEAVSDPLGDAWFDKQGEENADKCIFEYGKTFKGVNGSLYNIELGDRKYLIQQNWNPVTQSCAMTA